MKNSVQWAYDYLEELEHGSTWQSNGCVSGVDVGVILVPPSTLGCHNSRTTTNDLVAYSSQWHPPPLHSYAAPFSCFVGLSAMVQNLMGEFTRMLLDQLNNQLTPLLG